MKKIKIIVSGQVQGVSFRIYTRTEARKLGIYGYVRNLENGNVEILAIGGEKQINTLINWAKCGSPSAIVNNIDALVVTENIEQFKNFEIRY